MNKKYQHHSMRRYSSLVRIESILLFFASIGSTIYVSESSWQPWNYTGFDVFPALYFAAKPRFDLNAAELSKIAKFQLAIIEFRANQFDGEESGTNRWADGDEAGAEVRQCENLRAAFPNTAPPCLVYRNGMWGRIDVRQTAGDFEHHVGSVYR